MSSARKRLLRGAIIVWFLGAMVAALVANGRPCPPVTPGERVRNMAVAALIWPVALPVYLFSRCPINDPTGS